MVQHISPSSILLFLANRADWYQKYVLGIRDQKTGPAALTGSAFHKFADLRLKGDDMAHTVAVEMIEKARDVEWGMTGSAEKCKEELSKLIEAWEKEYSLPGVYLQSEYKGQAKIKGIKIPVKGFIDAVVELEPKRVVLVDWKTVKQYNTEVSPAFMLQAFVYKWLIESIEKWSVDRFDFVQIKASKNSDKSPQIKTLSMYFDELKEDEEAMKRLVNAAIKEMNRKTNHLPNLRDEYGAEESWRLYKKL